MFGSVSEKFRSYIFPSPSQDSELGDNLSRKRKRQFSEAGGEDSDVEILSVKRPRQTASNSVFSLFSGQVNKMTDWFRRRSTFSKDYFFKAVDDQKNMSTRPPNRSYKQTVVPTTNGRTHTSDGVKKSSLNKKVLPQTKRSYRDVVATSYVNATQVNGYSADDKFGLPQKPASQERFSLFSNSSIITSQPKPTAQLCVRLDEKEKYRQLLQQFSSVPIDRDRSTVDNDGNKSIFNTSSSLSSSKLNNTSYRFNSSRYNNISSSTKKIPSSSLNQSESKRYKIQTNHCKVTDPLVVNSSYLHKHHKPAVELLASAPSLPILDTSSILTVDDTINQTEHKSPEKIASPITRRKSFCESRSEMFEKLEDTLNEREKWLKEFKSTSDIDKEDRLRKISEAEVTVKVHHEWRKKKDEDFKKTLHERMKLLEPFTEEVILVDDEEESQLPELTAEMKEVIENGLRSGPSQEVLSEGYKLQILRQDMLTLKGLNWLNDEVINFYMNMLMERGQADNMSSVHAFNTFFYPKLMGAGHSAVRRWTKRVDVLAVDYILIPVHLGMHWCLAVIDFKTKCVKYFDSMGGTNNKCLNALRQYLCDESMDKKKQEFDLSGWSSVNVQDIPQQMNGSDCGMFSCKYAEYITREAKIDFTQEDMPYFRKRMVYEITTKQLLQ